MTKPCVIAAFGCAALLAGAVPGLAAPAGRGANAPQATHSVSAATYGGGGAILCIVGANCTPPILRVRFERRLRLRHCGRAADQYGFYGPDSTEFMQKCETMDDM